MTERIVDGVAPRRWRNRLLFILLVLSFLLPGVLARVAYDHGWFAGGVTNRGTLIAPGRPPRLEALAAQEGGRPLAADALSGQWWLVYVLPSQCEASCRNRLYQIRQVHKATGKDAERIGELLVLPEPPRAAIAQLLDGEFKSMRQIQAARPVVNRALAPAAAQASEAGLLYLMDPRGNLILSYAPEPDERQAILKARDVLKDLQRLLKASQVG